MNVTQRVLSILKMFSKGDEVCSAYLSSIFFQDIRTIQRDLKILKEFFPNIIQTKKGCYKLLSNHELKAIFDDPKEVKSLIEILSLIDSDSLTLLKDKKFDYLKSNYSKIYYFFENPIEDLKKLKFLEELKDAVLFQKYCDIVYEERDRKDLKDIRPYKILYAKNNWYLAAHTNNYKLNYGFKRFRINFITDVKIKSKTFKKDIEIVKHIENFQSLFEDFKTPQYEVILEASPNIERYFRVKKYLKSQKILEQKEDKSLLLSFKINNDMEIIPLIKTWLPDLKVISPTSLREKILEDIEKFQSDT
jgi:predicted DNA-binding transcriptional regulator YafY